MGRDLLCSVIIPTYNRGFILPRAVLSVAEQDCVPQRSVEIIVVDDGSQDGTRSLVKELKKDIDRQRVNYVGIRHSGEPGTVRNAGLEVAKGEFIAYCDSDDFWLPHHLATALQRFKRDPSLGMVSNYWALAQFVPQPDGDIATYIIVPPHDPDAVNTNCRVHRRECVDAVGYFNTSKWGEDQDFFGRVEAEFKTVKTRVVTSINGYIKGGNNLTYEFDAGVRSAYF